MIAKFRENNRAKGLLVILLLSVAGILFLSNLKIQQRRNQLNVQIDALRKEIQVLEEGKEFLQAKISEASKEAYLEKEAREKFNLKKPGEKVVVFTKEKTDEKEQQEKEKSLWQKFLERLEF